MKSQLKDIQDYFETLAVSYVLLKHSPTRKTFYKITGDESASLKTNAASPRLQVDHYGGRYKGSPESLDKPVNFSFKILVKADDLNEASKQAAYDIAETIMDDIIAKVAYDSLTICDYGVMFDSITFDKIGPEGQSEFGYRLTIPVRGYAPSYNPSKWTVE